jgi:SEC-C motif-containing protein
VTHASAADFTPDSATDGALPADPAVGAPAGPYQGNCPCLSGEQYVLCCGRFHRGDAEAPTAEQLMRSRYSAFVVGDAEYLLRTWHPDTRPEELELDPGLQWRRLDIISTVRGGPLDSEGVVEFAAHYRHDGERGVQRETSRFVRKDRRWYYLDALVSG